MGWILCARVCVYSVVSLEAQKKNVCRYTFLFSQRTAPGAVKRFLVILFPQECSGAGFVCGAPEGLGSDARNLCSSSVCVLLFVHQLVSQQYSLKLIWKVALSVPRGGVCMCNAACRGWPAERERDLLLVLTQVKVFSVLGAEWVNILSSFILVSFQCVN